MTRNGALWVLDNQQNHLLRYMPDQLTTTGTPTASVILNVGAGTLALSIPHMSGPVLRPVVGSK